MGQAPVLGLQMGQNLGLTLLGTSMMEPRPTNMLREHHKQDRGEIDSSLAVCPIHFSIFFSITEVGN
jgi:hypothetical protein